MSRYLSQKVSLLGTLESNLRELQGYDTLAYELIQNADDVHDDEGNPAATKIIFDIRDDALIVMNDGVFRKRDFDRMLQVNSGDKREEEGTTGAFGIGFTVVYQITDCPEIVSSGQHWRFFPERDEKNIEVNEVVREGTTFRLPYAIDPNSPLRIRLKQQTFDVSKLDEFEATICEAVSDAALFLKQLELLEVRRGGEVVHRITRVVEDEQVLLDKNGVVSSWMILHGDFQDDAQVLRSQYPSSIEKKKRSEVSLVIPEEGLKEYRLFAVLPTQQTTKLTFHVNADFYLRKDRKGIIFDDDYQSQWNRAAIRAIARIIVAEFDKLRGLGYQRLWELINSIYQCSLGDPIDDVFKELWKPVLDAVRDREIVYTTKNAWVRGADARILYEWDALSIFEALGLRTIVHNDLSIYQNLLLIFGARRLSVADIALQLQSIGLDRQTHISQVIPALQTRAAWGVLWSALDSMLNKVSPSNQEVASIPLNRCAIVMDEEGNLLLPTDVYAEGEDVQQIFWWLHWVNESNTDARKEIPIRLVSRFTVNDAINALEDREDLTDLWKTNRLDLPRLFKFLDSRESEIKRYSDAEQRLRALPLFPVAGELQPFSTDFYIPAGFDDPLGLATLVDLKATGDARRFLLALGFKELSFITYVKDELPKRFEPIDLTWEQLSELVQLLASQLATLRDHEPKLHPILARLPLIECTIKKVAPASHVYFAQDVQDFLGESALIAVQPELPSTRVLYEWLGVAVAVRTDDIIKRLREITASTDDFDEKFEIVDKGFRLLADRVSTESKLTENQLNILSQTAWLPAKQHDRLLRTKWFKPHELHSVFREFLFNESDALILGLSRSTQNRGSALVELLKVQNDIPPRFVVQHLRRCYEKPQPVSDEVYKFLNDAPKGEWVEKLRDFPCLWLNGRFTSPDRVFWNEHPFGAYRVTLPREWRKHLNLLEALKVKTSPDFDDYCWVLSEIELRFMGQTLPAAEKDILYRCWRDLSQLLADEKITRQEMDEMLSENRVFLNRDDILTKPIDLLFEDRPEIAAKFDERIAANIIPRYEEQWKGLEAGGVRSLTEVLRARLVECDDPIDDNEYLTRIQERKSLFKRVVDTENKRDTEQWIDSLLDNFSVKQADRLRVQFELKGFEKAISPAEDVVALWSEQERSLFYCPQSKNVHIHIAREMAYALKLTGKTSLIIEVILKAASVEEAQQSLDISGYPNAYENIQLAEIEPPIELEPESNEAIAEENDSGDQADEIESQAEEAITSSNEVEENMQTDDSHSIQEGQEISPQEHDANRAGVEQGRETANARARHNDETMEGHRQKPRKQTEKTPHNHRARGILRSYVTQGSEEIGETDGAANEHRNKVDRAGINFVLEFERANNRKPEEQDHNNEGFDIISVDEDGVVRYIEVKSLSGEWGISNPASISSSQYEAAREAGAAFWLYVVEKAHTTPRLYCIHNPAYQITNYLFDDGWMVLDGQEFEE